MNMNISHGAKKVYITYIYIYIYIAFGCAYNDWRQNIRNRKAA